MNVEIKIKIGENEVTMEEARKIYESLKEIFEKKASPLNEWDQIKKLIGDKTNPCQPIIPMMPTQPWTPYRERAPTPFRTDWPYWPNNYTITCKDQPDYPATIWI